MNNFTKLTLKKYNQVQTYNLLATINMFIKIARSN